MKPQTRKKFEILTKEAAKNASRAMLRLANEKITIKVTHVEIKNVHGSFSEIPPESMVAGIYLPVTGDVHGASLLIFPEEVANDLCNLLFRRSDSVKKEFSELDKSALKEVGNIICGSFLTVLSNTLKIKMIGSVPKFTFDIFGSVVNNLIIEFTQRFEKQLVVGVKFDFEHASVEGYMMIIFGFEEMELVTKVIDGAR